MPTFTIAQRNHDLDAHNAQLLAATIRDTSPEPPPEPTPRRRHPVTLSHLGCERQLRGIPVVGAPGVGGAIHGTRPGNHR